MALVALMAGCARAPQPALVVTHIPNPSGIHAANTPDKPDFPYVWFYRTEVSNATDRPIRIIGFEGCFLMESRWIPANVMNRPLTADDFSKWYTAGDPVTNGWIQPHATAACNPNWHGATSPVSPRCKWTYEGVDAMGNTCHAEAEIKTVPAPGK